MAASLRDTFPLHLLIGGEDYTYLLSDSFTFSNVDPGGYEMASFAIPKDLPHIQRGAPVKLDCGMQVAWEGRVKEPQRSLGSKTLIQCEGYGARLKEVDLSMVFVDRDLTRWGAPGVARNLSLTEANYTLGSAQVAADPVSHEPAIIQNITGSWASPYKPLTDSWYDAGPLNKIASIYYALTSNAAATSLPLNELLLVSSDANESAIEATSALNPSATGTFTPSNHYRYAAAECSYGTTPGGTSAAEYWAIWRNLAVYGNHGLSKRGSAPQGFYTSDIVGWVASRVSGIQAGVIPEAAFYTVPHSVYYTPVEAQQIVADMAKLVGYHWGVWESQTYLAGNATPRLDFRPYPTTPTAWAWRRECEQLDVREDLSSQYNVALVSFSEAAGNQEVVRVEVANPILAAAGISERVIQLSLGTSVKAAAEEYGRFSLELLQEQARVLGSAAISEPIHRMNGAAMAPWMLKAGIDRLRVPDLPSADVWGVYSALPITRVECSGSASGISTSVELGQGKNLLEALTAELQQAAVLGGQGG